jgi:hypothetical protein
MVCWIVFRTRLIPKRYDERGRSYIRRKVWLSDHCLHSSSLLYIVRLVPSRYLNFNFIGTNRYIHKFSSFALPVSLYAPTSGRAPALVFKSDWGRVWYIVWYG